MKKSLLLAAAVLTSMVATAQIEWKCETAETPAPSGEVKGVKASNAVVGSGLKLDGVVASRKVGTGETEAFPVSEGGEGWLKLTPTNEQVTPEGAEKATTLDEYRNLASAVADPQNMFINFPIEAEGEKDVLKIIGNIEFEASRVGTDAVRLNARILGNEGDYTSNWLITQENVASVADGGFWSVKEKEGKEWFEVSDGGFAPDRNDGTKTGEGQSSKAYSKLTIPAPDNQPDDLYEATLQIVIYGISSNKNCLLHGVKLNVALNGEAGISNVKAEKVNGAIFNLAGQKVAANFKGIAIQNGKKVVLK